jgi:RNA polymerase sigma-70 factor (ECF subfamily)
MAETPHTLHTQFEKMFRDFFTPLVWYAMKIVKDQDTAREIVHSVFVTLWEKADSIDFTRPVKPYLYTSVYNRSVNYLRDHKKFTGEEKINPEAFVKDDDSLESQEMEERIYAAIAGLPDKTREIFELSRFENKKYQEIADIHKISIKTVEARMSEALKILRVKLSDYIKILIILMVDIFQRNL